MLLSMDTRSLVHSFRRCWRISLICLLLVRDSTSFDAFAETALYDKQFNLEVELHHERDTLEENIAALDLENPERMTTAQGGEYHCVRKKRESDADENVEESGALSRNEKLRRQLQGLRGSCIERRVDYWSYVVCPFDKVEQVHYERRKRGTSFLLGNYEQGEADHDHEQMYVGGTDGRQCKVTYVCDTTQGKTGIASVTETRVHEYAIVVQTPLACTMSEEVQAKQLIATLSGQCMKRLDGWWTYEFCFHGNLRQYHTEKNGKVIEYILGKYDKATNKELEENGGVLIKQSPSGKPGYLEKYVHGTTCDLTGEKRWTKVIYACFPEIDMSGLVSVEETSTCGYTIKVSVPSLCGHPFFIDTSDNSDGRTDVETVFCLSDTLFGELKSAAAASE